MPKQAGSGAREHGAGANFFVREHAKNLPKPRQCFFELAGDGFKRIVACADASAAVEEDDIYRFRQGVEEGRDLRRLVWDNVVSVDGVSRFGNKGLNELAAFISLFCARVTHRNDGACYRGVFRQCLMFFVSHQGSGCISSVRGSSFSPYHRGGIVSVSAPGVTPQDSVCCQDDAFYSTIFPERQNSILRACGGVSARGREKRRKEELVSPHKQYEQLAGDFEQGLDHLQHMLGGCAIFYGD